MEVLQFDKYRVKTDGSGSPTVRNRRFLKKIWPYGMKSDEVKQSVENLADMRKQETCSKEPAPEDLSRGLQTRVQWRPGRERTAPEDVPRQPKAAGQRRSGRERSAPEFLGVKPKAPMTQNNIRVL